MSRACIQEEEQAAAGIFAPFRSSIFGVEFGDELVILNRAREQAANNLTGNERVHEGSPEK